MESDCCGARPYFSLGYVHGIKMAVNDKYYGICSDCRGHAEFTKQERKEHEYNKKTKREISMHS